MILYHGSNIEIEAVDFAKSKPGKDFGVGFYLSADELQAQEMNANIIDVDKFVDEIKRKGGETYQYFFGTEKALKYLKKL